jgi:hypothetical protein
MNADDIKDFRFRRFDLLERNQKQRRNTLVKVQFFGCDRSSTAVSHGQARHVGAPQGELRWMTSARE